MDHKIDNDQFTISVELLNLMQWIIENDQEGLKRLIGRALSRGLQSKLQTQQESPADTTERAHYSIIDFFLLMEALLIESSNEATTKNSLLHHMIPSVNRIDAAAFDSKTVRFSLEQATNKMQKNPQKNPQELLIKELIKNWKPSKKSKIN